MPGTMAHDTTTSATAARTMLTSRSVPIAPLRTSTLTVVPASPRTQPTTSSRSWPWVALPSTSVSSSPALSPAFSAGLPLNTWSMTGRPSSAVSIRTPIPT